MSEQNEDNLDQTDVVERESEDRSTDVAVKNLPARIDVKAGGSVSAFIPQSIDQAWRLANIMWSGFLCPKDDTKEMVMGKIVYGAELGLTPAASVQGIAMINGRPSLWGDTLLAMALVHPSLISLDETMDGSGDDRRAICVIERKLPTGAKRRVQGSFSVMEAKRAGLWETEAKVTRHRRGGGGSYEKDNDSPWYRYPDRMLAMRARAFALRDSFADVLRGMRVREEEEDVSRKEEIVDEPPKADEKPRRRRKAAEDVTDGEFSEVKDNAPPPPAEDPSQDAPPPPAEDEKVQANDEAPPPEEGIGEPDPAAEEQAPAPASDLVQLETTKVTAEDEAPPAPRSPPAEPKPADPKPAESPADPKPAAGPNWKAIADDLVESFDACETEDETSDVWATNDAAIERMPESFRTTVIAAYDKAVDRTSPREGAPPATTNSRSFLSGLVEGRLPLPDATTAAGWLTAAKAIVATSSSREQFDRWMNADEHKQVRQRLVVKGGAKDELRAFADEHFKRVAEARGE